MSCACCRLLFVVVAAVVVERGCRLLFGANCRCPMFVVVCLLFVVVVVACCCGCWLRVVVCGVLLFAVCRC